MNARYGIDPLDAAFYDTVHDYRDPATGVRGAAALAQRLNVNPGTLQNKANPNMDTHQPSVKELRAVMLVARDFRVLQQLAADCGHCAVRLVDFHDIADEHLLDKMLEVARGLGDVAEALQAALADGRVTTDEYRHFSAEIDELVRAALELRARLRSLVVDPDRLTEEIDGGAAGAF